MFHASSFIRSPSHAILMSAGRVFATAKNSANVRHLLATPEVSRRSVANGSVSNIDQMRRSKVYRSHNARAVAGQNSVVSHFQRYPPEFRGHYYDVKPCI